MSASSPASVSLAPARTASAGARTVPASPAQEQRWFLDQRHPGRPVNNLPLALSLEGRLDPRLLAAALNDVVARHEIFRTHLDVIDGATVQVIAPALQIPLPVVDLRLLPAGAREVQAFRLAREEAARPFDPRHLPLLRAQLYLFEETKRILVLTVHRAIFDHDSLAILVRELAACYEIRRGANASPLPPLSFSYAEYAARQWAQAGDLDWWRGRLAGRPAPLHLPGDRTSPTPLPPGSARVERLNLPESLHGAVGAAARRHGTTSLVVLLAAFQALLHRHTAQTDFVLGVALSDRHAPDQAALVGPLSKVVPFRADLSGDPSFHALLERVAREVRETSAHSAAPFERLAAVAAGWDDTSALPGPIQFSHEMRPAGGLAWPGVALCELELDSGSCAGDLAFHVIEHARSLELRAEYDAERFSAAAIQRLLGHYGVLLQAAAARPQARLSDLPLLTAPERRRLLTEWNSTFSDFPRDATLAELVCAHAAHAPDRIALDAGAAGLTWQQLDQRSNQFARHLRALGVKPGQTVGLCLDYSPQGALALLGVWKAGAAALPLDAAQPGSKLAQCVADAKPGLVFTTAALRHLLPELPGRVLVLETEAGDIRRADDAGLAALGGPDDLAVILPTAGTGGAPKLVELSQRALVGAVHALRRSARIAPEDVLLATAPWSSFDLLLEIFAPLVFGARVVLAQPSDVADPIRLGSLAVSSGATLMFGRSSFWQRLLDAGWVGSRSLRLFLTGEPVTRTLVEKLQACGRETWNLYGAVETAGVALAAPMRPEQPPTLLGRPMANVQVHLLDAHLQPVPVGVAGEIFVGGDTLALGYRQPAELTAAQFVPDPFRRIPGARLFRTGDLARRLPNGEIEFLGRADRPAPVAAEIFQPFTS